MNLTNGYMLKGRNVRVSKSPFPHWVIDDAFSASLVKAAEIEWPSEDWVHWHLYDTHTSRKFATKDIERLPPASKLLFNSMCSIDLVELTGSDVFPDLSGYGAGLHWVPKHGYLERHLDSNIHPLTGWTRKYSMCLYLHDVDGGGDLIFENEGRSESVSITPTANRLVIFECTEHSYHGVPGVIQDERGRKSIACFFWSLKQETFSVRTSAQFDMD